MTNYTEVETGEYINGSLCNDHELNQRIIELAENYGFTHDSILEDDIEDTEEKSEIAIDYLNDTITKEGYSWRFNENWPGSFGLWENDN